MVAGPRRLGLALLLLPAGPAVVLVDGYALFGLPPARRAAWGAEAAPALSIELGLSCGAAVERRLSCDLSVYLSFVRGRFFLR